MKLTGYAVPWTAAPGDSVQFKVSTTAANYRAEILRLIHGDKNPRGPGFKAERVSADIEGDYPGREQIIRTGSWVEVPDAAPLAVRSGFTLTAWIWPTTPASGVQGLITKWDGTPDVGYGLDLIDGAFGHASSHPSHVECDQCTAVHSGLRPGTIRLDDPRVTQRTRVPLSH